MTRKMVLSALASVALVTAGAAVAKPGKGFGNGPKVAAQPKGKGAAKAKAKLQPRGINDTGAAMRAEGRANSQGPAHASPRALERASANSVLAGNRVVAGPLTGLSVGTPIQFGNDIVGTVERIMPSAGNRVSNVLVRLSNGRIVPLAPGSLSADAGVWTATSLEPSGHRR